MTTLSSGDQRELRAFCDAIEANVEASQAAMDRGDTAAAGYHLEVSMRLHKAKTRLLSAIAKARLVELGIEPWRVVVTHGGLQ